MINLAERLEKLAEVFERGDLSQTATSWSDANGALAKVEAIRNATDLRAAAEALRGQATQELDSELAHLFTRLLVAAGCPADDDDLSNDAFLGRECIRLRHKLRAALSTPQAGGEALMRQQLRTGIADADRAVAARGYKLDPRIEAAGRAKADAGNTVSEEAFARIVETCENPPPPTDALRAMMKSARALSGPAGGWEEIARAIREHVKCDASGLSPAVASVFLTGFDEAAEAVWRQNVQAQESRAQSAEATVARMREALEGVLAVVEHPAMYALWLNCTERLAAYNGPRFNVEDIRAALLPPTEEKENGPLPGRAAVQGTTALDPDRQHSAGEER